MCLDIDRYHPRVAKEDITCHKTLLRYPHLTKEHIGKHVLLKAFGRDYKGIVISVDRTVARIETISTVISSDNPSVDSIWMNDVEIEKKFFTPFQRAIVEIGSTYESPIVIHRFGGLVEQALHSYKSKRPSRAKSVIAFSVRCTIPKGATYHLGHFGDHLSYASDKLIYEEINL